MPKELKKNNRLSQRVEFVKKHKHLFDKLNPDGNWLQAGAKDIISLARAELRFSKKTMNCDIYSSVIKTFDWMENGGIVDETSDTK